MTYVMFLNIDDRSVLGSAGLLDRRQIIRSWARRETVEGGHGYAKGRMACCSLSCRVRSVHSTGCWFNSAWRKLRISAGLGGQPGMRTSTGIWRSTGPVTA
jgi:hypothetical protein